MYEDPRLLGMLVSYVEPLFSYTKRTERPSTHDETHTPTPCTIHKDDSQLGIEELSLEERSVRSFMSVRQTTHTRHMRSHSATRGERRASSLQLQAIYPCTANIEVSHTPRAPSR